MAKAHIALQNGTTVNIEGSADEVAILIERFSRGNLDTPPSLNQKPKKRMPGSQNSRNAGKKSGGPTSLITELAQDGFFKEKRTLANIQKKLEELGHIYAQSSISPILTRLTRKRTIRRIKESKGWAYVK